MLLIEYVTKEQFEEIKSKYSKCFRYWYNHEFPETEHLDTEIIKGKLAISIRHEIEGQ